MNSNRSPEATTDPILKLYIAGETPSARRALDNRARLLEAANGGLEIAVVDILADPAEAESAGILATPTLSDESVTPPRRLVGDIGDVAQVLDYLGYAKKDIGL
jgi:circadian clock protein KaiB